MRTKKLAVISAVFLTLSAASAHAATTMLLIGVGNGGGVSVRVSTPFMGYGCLPQLTNTE